ncbi:mCG147792 [Mus musculus]|nr:mCG147792 [Mus musculus]
MWLVGPWVPSFICSVWCGCKWVSMVQPVPCSGVQVCGWHGGWQVYICLPPPELCYLDLISLDWILGVLGTKQLWPPYQASS